MATTIRYLRNDETGELIPPRSIGPDERGQPVYQFVEGFTPVDDQGRPAPAAWTPDGHWIIHPGAGEVESRAHWAAFQSCATRANAQDRIAILRIHLPVYDRLGPWAESRAEHGPFLGR